MLERNEIDKSVGSDIKRYAFRPYSNPNQLILMHTNRSGIKPLLDEIIPILYECELTGKDVILDSTFDPYNIWFGIMKKHFVKGGTASIVIDLTKIANSDKLFYTLGKKTYRVYGNLPKIEEMEEEQYQNAPKNIQDCGKIGYIWLPFINEQPNSIHYAELVKSEPDVYDLEYDTQEQDRLLEEKLGLPKEENKELERQTEIKQVIEESPYSLDEKGKLKDF